MIWWIIVPIVIAIVYLVLGFIITKALIKKDVVHSPLDFWFYFLLWLPIFFFGGLWTLLCVIARAPINFAYKHLDK